MSATDQVFSERETLRYKAKMDLRAQQAEDGDAEIQHSEADDILCALLDALGFSDVVEEYKRVPKWFA